MYVSSIWFGGWTGYISFDSFKYSTIGETTPVVECMESEI